MHCQQYAEPLKERLERLGHTVRIVRCEEDSRAQAFEFNERNSVLAFFFTLNLAQDKAGDMKHQLYSDPLGIKISSPETWRIDVAVRRRRFYTQLAEKLDKIGGYLPEWDDIDNRDKNFMLGLLDCNVSLVDEHGLFYREKLHTLLSGERKARERLLTINFRRITGWLLKQFSQRKDLMDLMCTATHTEVEFKELFNVWEEEVGTHKFRADISRRHPQENIIELHNGNLNAVQYLPQEGLSRVGTTVIHTLVYGQDNKYYSGVHQKDGIFKHIVLEICVPMREMAPEDPLYRRFYHPGVPGATQYAGIRSDRRRLCVSDYEIDYGTSFFDASEENNRMVTHKDLDAVADWIHQQITVRNLPRRLRH